jgi:predicted PurR-regulated permease PerM
MDKESQPSLVRVQIAWSAVLKVLAGVVLAVVAVKLWPLCRLLIVASLLAVPLYRLVLWLCRKGWPRWAGLLAASLALIFAVLGLAALAGPVAVNQVGSLGKTIPKLEQQLLGHFPAGPVRDTMQRAAEATTSRGFLRFSQGAVDVAKAMAGALLEVVLVIALTIYLIVDGPRAVHWLVAYFPRSHHSRVSQGLEKIGDRMVAFIVGQAILSGLFAAYVLVVLSILRVPMALLLAAIAGFLDVVPVLGISITLVLGATLAASVSPAIALLVVGLYGAYHVFENYFLLPKVYGKHLRLSTLAVIVAMIAGGMVAGVIGAVAVLPLVAAYPALEILWLSPQLEPEVVKDHQKQIRTA